MSLEGVYTVQLNRRCAVCTVRGIWLSVKCSAGFVELEQVCDVVWRTQIMGFEHHPYDLLDIQPCTGWKAKETKCLWDGCDVDRL